MQGGLWHNKGNVLFRMKRYAEALGAYEYALTFPVSQSVTLSVLHNMGNVFTEMLHLEEALLCFDEALEMAPRYAPLWTNKARALYYLDRYAEALASVEQAYAFAQDDKIVQRIGAMAASEVKRMEEMFAK